ncbi:anti-repressor SinI family protein [Lentibacillus sp. L22]|nr:anti-repressor SinI family protein [Lentibacillus daqui]
MLKFVGKRKMDVEWVRLIMEAKMIGITKEEIRLFLKSQKKK